MGSAPASGAVFRALAENIGRVEISEASMSITQASDWTRGASSDTRGGCALRLSASSALQTLRIIVRGEDFGVRWQSAAATPLFDYEPSFQSGVALRFPPQSKKICLRLCRAAPWRLCGKEFNLNSEVDGERTRLGCGFPRPRGKHRSRRNFRSFHVHHPSKRLDARRVQRHPWRVCFAALCVLCAANPQNHCARRGFWSAVAERSGDTAFRLRTELSKRRGASLPAAVQKDLFAALPRCPSASLR